MNPNPHDIWEALREAPGDQVLELGTEIDEMRKALTQAGIEIDKQLAYLASRTREIAPVVEMLHEVAERAQPLGPDEDLETPTVFIKKQSPPFAALLLRRLAKARATDDVEKAGGLRDVIATYARCSPIEDVREMLIDGLRVDALAHGETRPGYVIRPVQHLTSAHAERRRLADLTGD